MIYDKMNEESVTVSGVFPCRKGQRSLLLCMQKKPESGWTIKLLYGIIKYGILDRLTV